jgi:hypothetical protein
MQKKDIKIGEKYGVLAHISKRAEAKAGATVVDFDGEYEGYRPGSWGSRKVTKTGGITVRFDEPVVKRWDGYTPLQEILDGQWVDSFKEDAKKDAITVDVLPSARHVVGLWSEITADRDIAKTRREEFYADNQKRAEELVPRRLALNVAIDEAGLTDHVKVTFGQAKVSDDQEAYVSFRQILITPEGLEKLLGIGK